MHDHGVRQEALRAIALASYHHAQSNPRAVMYGKRLDAAKYDASRWIAEPFHLYDCCMENDGAAALVLVPEERAGDFGQKPVYVLGAAVGSGFRTGAIAHNSPLYASASFDTVAPDLYRMAAPNILPCCPFRAAGLFYFPRSVQHISASPAWIRLPLRHMSGQAYPRHNNTSYEDYYSIVPII